MKLRKSAGCLAAMTWTVIALAAGGDVSRPHPVDFPESPWMLDLDGAGADGEMIDYDALPRLQFEHVVINDVRDRGGTWVNQHAYLAWFDGRFWAMWSDGLVFNDLFYLVGGRHVDYPHMIEHDGFLLISFSGAKQTVEVLKIPIDALEKRGGRTQTEAK